MELLTRSSYIEEKEEQIQPFNHSATEDVTPSKVGAGDPSGDTSQLDEKDSQNERDPLGYIDEETESHDILRGSDEI